MAIRAPNILILVKSRALEAVAEGYTIVAPDTAPVTFLICLGKYYILCNPGQSGPVEREKQSNSRIFIGDGSFGKDKFMAT